MKKGIVFFQDIDLQALTFPKRTLQQNWLKYLTLVIIIILVSLSVFTINENIALIITNTQKRSAPLSRQLLRNIIVSGIRSGYALVNAIIFSSLISSAYKRNYREREKNHVFFFFYFLYLGAAVIIFALNYGLLPSEKALDELLNQPSSATFLPLGEAIYTIQYLKYVFFALLFLEWLYEIYHWYFNRYVNPKDLKYSYAKVIAFSFLVVYALVLMILLPPDFQSLKLLLEKIVLWFSNQSGLFELNSNFISKMFLVTVIILLLATPLLFFFSQANTQAKFLKTKSIYFSFTIAYYVVSIISGLISLRLLIASNISLRNYGFLLTTFFISVSFFLFIIFNQTILKTSLFLYVAATFALLFNAILFIAFNFGTSGLLNIDSTINLLLMALSNLPILLFLMVNGRSLPAQKRWVKSYHFFLGSYLSLVSLALFSSIYVSRLDLGTQKLLNTLVANIGIWLFLYLLILLFIMIAFLVIFWKLLRVVSWSINPLVDQKQLFKKSPKSVWAQKLPPSF